MRQAHAKSAQTNSHGPHRPLEQQALCSPTRAGLAQRLSCSWAPSSTQACSPAQRGVAGPHFPAAGSLPGSTLQVPGVLLAPPHAGGQGASRACCAAGERGAGGRACAPARCRASCPGGARPGRAHAAAPTRSGPPRCAGRRAMRSPRSMRRRGCPWPAPLRSRSTRRRRRARSRAPARRRARS